MRKHGQSFRVRLTAAFLACSLAPLLICSVSLVQVMKMRVDSQTEENMTQQTDALVQSLDQLDSGFRQAVEQLQENEVLLDALQGGERDDTQVNNELFLATEELRRFASVRIYNLAGKLCYSTENSPREKAISTAWGILHAARAANGTLAYQSSQTAPGNDGALFQGAVVLKNKAGQFWGYLVMAVNEANFRSLFDGKCGPQGELLLLNSFFRPVYATESGLLGDLATSARQRLLAGERLNIDGENTLCRISRHENTGLYLVLQQPQVMNAATTRLLRAVGLVGIVLSVFVTVLISLPLSRQISLPIQRLQNAFVKLEENDLSVRVDNHQRDELGRLAEEFNRMVKALQQNRAELLRNQQELNEAQIRLLQAQLNPHFLCNTLDTMKWISKINHVPEVAEMSANLADILRLCISPEQFVPLYREMEILARYVDIQRVRMGDSFRFRVELPEELGSCLVPKMILQPIVENSMIHGLSGMPDSQILVEVAQEGQMLRISVTDNGCGLPEEWVGKPYARSKEDAGGHLGLYNVDTILTRHYGTGCGLFLDRGPGGVGTKVSAVLPLEKEKTEDVESFGC